MQFCTYPIAPRSTLLHIMEKLIGGGTALDLQKDEKIKTYTN